MIAQANKYYGKYEGVVTNNIDPEKRGRIQVRVKSVTGFWVSTWARPSSTWGGFQKGVFAVPPINTSVFVEYLNGDIDKPVVTGCYWETFAESPVKAATTTPGNALTIQAGVLTSIQLIEGNEIKLQCGASSITITPTKIEIDAPEVSVNGRINTSISAGAENKIEGKLVNVKGMMDVNGNLTVLE